MDKSVALIFGLTAIFCTAIITLCVSNKHHSDVKKQALKTIEIITDKMKTINEVDAKDAAVGVIDILNERIC